MIDHIRPLLGEKPPAMADRLKAFFDNLRDLSLLQDTPAQDAISSRLLETAALASLMNNLRMPFAALEGTGLLANPWLAASLRRDEVRNAAVLRWFLDPNGDHGCGGVLLEYLLERAGCQLTYPFPIKPSVHCALSVEECPDGDRASRVDIQIDDPTFFMLVEVKIDAYEQPNQLDRYCDIAAARAGGMRPWTVVFLTRDGRAPTTAERHTAKVLAMSWKELALGLRRVVRASPPIPGFLASTFAAHMAKL